MSRQRGVSSRSRSAGPITLTGRGGIVVMFGAGVVCGLLSRWLGVGLLAGAGFAIGCALAAFATRPADLLTLVVSPPLVFFAATVTVVFVTTLGSGSLLRGMTVGLLTALAATAPWLFFGTVLVVVICLARGLMTNVRELQDKLIGVRLFEKEENENPVRWDESPTTTQERRRTHHGDVD
ncbi:DUF6542 domain-containing protein [Actinomadura madurae]|uniref:DUF6542 domain-containing protein n=1 Tax=Actinomadura madurae TaxID=1993 RepID=UPI0020273DFB|nr:DUF6542 domain-containing protein [Actinomadura madurae]MCP9950225.1 hypothetical protein [Actinomadura madurae]MCP9966998.1 hypothetical protein [Actinomadura madurae]MCP9979464.1 hypothetical protein [Actinomadura madurae]MCQ0015675.1 hypothetical protein [Actinomadura madurae]URM95781.1 hypothetical protein LUW76_16385 [Actinomadura madurae]